VNRAIWSCLIMKILKQQQYQHHKKHLETPFLLKSDSFEQNMQKQHKNNLSTQSNTSQIQQIHGTYKLK